MLIYPVNTGGLPWIFLSFAVSLSLRSDISAVSLFDFRISWIFLNIILYWIQYFFFKIVYELRNNRIMQTWTPFKYWKENEKLRSYHDGKFLIRFIILRIKGIGTYVQIGYSHFSHSAWCSRKWAMKNEEVLLECVSIQNSQKMSFLLFCGAT